MTAPRSCSKRPLASFRRRKVGNSLLLLSCLGAVVSTARAFLPLTAFRKPAPALVVTRTEPSQLQQQTPQAARLVLQSHFDNPMYGSGSSSGSDSSESSSSTNNDARGTATTTNPGGMPGIPGPAAGGMPGIPGPGGTPNTRGASSPATTANTGGMPGIPGPASGGMPGIPGPGGTPASGGMPGIPGPGGTPNTGGGSAPASTTNTGGMPGIPGPGSGGMPGIPGPGGASNTGRGSSPASTTNTGGMPGIPGPASGGMPGIPGPGGMPNPGMSNSASREPATTREPTTTTTRRSEPANTRTREPPNSRMSEPPTNPRTREPPNSRMNEPASTRTREPPNSRMNEPPNSRMREPPTNRRSEPANNRMREPPTTRMNEPPNSRMRDPPTTRMNEPPNSRMREPPTTRMNEPENTRMREPQMTRMNEPPNSRMRDPPTTRMNEPPNSRMREPPTTRMSEPEYTRMREPPTTRLNEPENTRMREPQTTRMRESDYTRTREPRAEPTGGAIRMSGATLSTSTDPVLVKKSVPLDAQLDYARNGHAVLRSFLDPNDLIALRRKLKKEVMAPLQAWQQKVEVASDSPTLAMSCRTIEDCQNELERLGLPFDFIPFLQYFNSWREVNVVETLCYELGEAAATLLDVPAVRLYQDTIFWKRSGDGPTPWHTDARMCPLDTSHMVTFWISLEDFPLESSGLIYCSKSHSDFALPFWNDFDGPEYQRLEERYKNSAVHYMPIRPGDVTVHSGWTLHCADGNQDIHDRIALAITFVDARAEVREDAISDAIAMSEGEEGEDEGVGGGSYGDNEDRWSYIDWVKDVPPRTQFTHKLVPIVYTRGGTK